MLRSLVVSASLLMHSSFDSYQRLWFVTSHPTYGLYYCLQNVLKIEASLSCLLENFIAIDYASTFSYMPVPHACYCRFIWKVFYVFVVWICASASCCVCVSYSWYMLMLIVSLCVCRIKSFRIKIRIISIFLNLWIWMSRCMTQTYFECYKFDVNVVLLIFIANWTYKSML